MTDNRAYLGSRVEIQPAYNSETGDRDIRDEVTGLVYYVVGDLGSDLALGEHPNDSPHYAVLTVSRLRCKVLNAPTY